MSSDSRIGSGGPQKPFLEEGRKEAAPVSNLGGVAAVVSTIAAAVFAARNEILKWSGHLGPQGEAYVKMGAVALGAGALASTLSHVVKTRFQQPPQKEASSEEVESEKVEVSFEAWSAADDIIKELVASKDRQTKDLASLKSMMEIPGAPEELCRLAYNTYKIDEQETRYSRGTHLPYIKIMQFHSEQTGLCDPRARILFKRMEDPKENFEIRDKDMLEALKKFNQAVKDLPDAPILQEDS